MNTFDLLLAAVLALAAWSGYRVGLVRGVFAWAGLGIGLVVAVVFVEDVAVIFKRAAPQSRFFVALAFMFLVVVIAQTLGLALGAAVDRVLPRRGPARAVDRSGGAVLGVAIAIVVLWLWLPALASAPGWTARSVRGSWIARQVQALTPDPPPSVEALGRLVAEAPYPEVFRDLTTRRAGEPPTTSLDPGVVARVAPGVVRVEGNACNLVIDGSGFAVSPSVVVTNAHVVAGERATFVYGEDGRRFDAVVVAFDPARDLALLRVDDGRLTPLALGDAEAGEVGVVLGHPGGGPLRATPARVEEAVVAHGTDIYRTSPTRRRVLVMAARLEPGDSGAPLVDAEGTVVGVAFAIDPGDEGTAYALARSELDAVLRTGLEARAPVDTGPCLVG